MRKLQLRALALGASEVLSRSQLKNILGGSGGGSDDTFECYSCRRNNDFEYGYGCCNTHGMDCDPGTCTEYSCD